MINVDKYYVIYIINLHNNISAKPMDDQTDRQFYNNYDWLKIYQCPFRDSMNNPIFHYFSEDLPGYQKVSLRSSTKPSRKPIQMYYQLDDTETISMQKVDQSPIIDFNYMQYHNELPGKQIVVNRGSVVKQSQWVQKYEPKHFIDLLTDDKVNKDLLTWLKTWENKISGKITHEEIKKPKTASIFTPTKNFQKGVKDHHAEALKTRNLILLAGPPGCGKTTLIRVIAKHCKFEVQQINASNDRSANLLIDKLQNISGNETIRKNKKPTLICLDEVDGAAQTEASGLSKVLKFIEEGSKEKKVGNKQNKNKVGNNKIPEIGNKDKNQMKDNRYQKKQLIGLNRPVIFICNDPFVKGLKQLRQKAHVIYFSSLATDRVVKRLKQICTNEKVYIENSVLHKICQICSNDIRSCIGILQLVVKQKRISNRNPKQIIQKLKLSFVKDNQSTINDFLSNLLNRKKDEEFSSQNHLLKIQRNVLQIGNTSLLVEYFFQNFLAVKGINRNQRALLKIYGDLVECSVSIKNSFKFRNEVDSSQSAVFINFYLNILPEQNKRVEFPSTFFQNIKKHKINEEILDRIYENMPPGISMFLNRHKIMRGDYLYSLFIGIQAQTTKDSQIGKIILRMLTYGFTFKRQNDKFGHGPIFSPEIDSLLKFKNQKLEYILSNSSKIAMQENFEFYRHKKDLLLGLQLKDNTENMLNQMNLQSRKKRKNNYEFGLQYKFQEGTGTKITQKLVMKDFF